MLTDQKVKARKPKEKHYKASDLFRLNLVVFQHHIQQLTANISGHLLIILGYKAIKSSLESLHPILEWLN